jgi:cutinase
MGVNPIHAVKRSAGTAAAALHAAPSMIIGAAAMSVPVASAACPGAEVVFARGREEPPGAGLVGDAFANSLRAKTQLPVGVYGVNYPADVDPAKGANDMSAHVQSMAKHCPNTREVLGGYSLGAVAADLVVAVTQPSFGFKEPLPPGIDQHVAAVALFGNGTQRVLGPVPSFSPAFAGKTIEECAPGDPICSGTGKAVWASHLQPSYIDSGLVDQAASFAAGKL